MRYFLADLYGSRVDEHPSQSVVTEILSLLVNMTALFMDAHVLLHTLTLVP